LARLQITPTADRRSAPRRQLRLGSALQTTGEEVIIHDLSSSGMLIETAAKLAPFDGLEIELPQAGIRQALVVWSSGPYYGCEFQERLSQAVISAARLRSAPIVSPEEAPPPSPAITRSAAQEQTLEDPGTSGAIDEERASVTVRLRVIFGSAILLWTIIIWAIASFIKSL
jgi:hypothetical protein